MRLLLHALDGFVLTAVGALVLLHIAPRALALGGFWSAAAAAVGLALPALFERMVFERRARGWAVAVGLIGLVSHTLIDGAAMGSEKHGDALSWAIVLHRLPAGILVWWLVRPAFGLRRASIMLAGLILATIAGFILGTRFDFVEERSLAVFEAFVAGALLHVLLSHGPELHGEESVPHNRVAELFGAALGVAMVVLVPESSGHEHAPHAFGAAGNDLLRLSYAIALPLISGLALAGTLATTRFAAGARGLVAAVVRPAGAGGAVRDFRDTGDLLALAATPQLGPPAILISLVLLGPTLALVRFAAAIVAAIAVALIVRRVLGHPRVETPNDRDAPAPLTARAAAALRLGFVGMMDESAAWILVGVASHLLLRGASVEISPFLSVPLAALAALFPFVCATGATPLAAAAVTAGLSPGTAIAFLIAGSTVHPPALAAIRDRFEGRGAILFAGATFGMATILGITADLALPRMSPPALSFDLDGSIDRAAAIFLLTLIAAALVRLGPRGFVRTLFRPDSAERPTTDHHHHG